MLRVPVQSQNELTLVVLVGSRDESLGNDLLSHCRLMSLSFMPLMSSSPPLPLHDDLDLLVPFLD